MKRPGRIVAAAALFALVGWFALWIAAPIDLTTADLGRHLRNGQIIRTAVAAGDGPSLRAILRTNFYSQDQADFLTINHHWATGVVFSVVHDLVGFRGLSIFNIALLTLALLLAFDLARRRSDLTTALLLALLVVPLVAERREIRPELFGFVLLALFLWLLERRDDGVIPPRVLLVAIPLGSMIWINFHISFVFGVALLGLNLLEEIFRARRPLPGGRPARPREALALVGLSLAAACVNPFGVRLVVYPLRIFENYGTVVAENQSIRWLQSQGYINPGFTIYAMVVALLALAGATLVVERRPPPFRLSAMTLVIGLLAALAVRNLALFGLCALPTLAAWSPRSDGRRRSARGLFLAALVACHGWFFVSRWNYIDQRLSRIAIGLPAGTEGAAEFIRGNGIHGPIFNNFNIGGYVIYYLFPQIRPFVDNRPEAYPASWLDESYVSPQESPELWAKLAESHRFNAIVFQHRDGSVSGRMFFIARMTDPAWAPVFVDERVIVYVRRNDENRRLIERFEIPKERFKVAPRTR